jgi:predicted O-methyltransferase YrrM
MKDARDAILQPDQATYLEHMETVGASVLGDLGREMEALAERRREPISDPEVARFLAVVARARAPRFVVELGTNIGYGAIALARAAEDARVVTFEVDLELVELARGFIARAGLSHRIEVRRERALEGLAKLETGTPIDLAYVDCVKEEYGAYLDALVPRLAPRGVIVADNVLWKGLVARDPTAVPAAEQKRTAALRAFNEKLMSHPRLDATVLPFGDGVAYAVLR